MHSMPVEHDTTTPRDQISTRRKTRTAAVVAVSLLVALSASWGRAAPPTITQAVTPGTVSYQGQVQAGDGSAYADGVYGIEFRLYDAASEGTLLWGARYQPYLKSGFFNVILGQTSVGESGLSGCTYPAVGDFWKAVWIDPNNANKNRYLSLTIVTERGAPVGTPHESFPRQQLQASPFALQAQFAQQADSASRSLGNFSVATNLYVSGSLSATSAEVSGTLSANSLRASSVTSSGTLAGNALTVTNATVNGSLKADSLSGFGTIPVGAIVMWSGATLPVGWALCDGTTQNGHATPDLRGRFVLGSGSGANLTSRTLQATGGEETHTLSSDEMPSHTHGLRIKYYAAADTDNEINVARYDETNGGGTSATTGGGAAHNNMPPFYVLAYIMRVK